MRKYQLLCPIARALDRVGDRWTLLILRDLHAGPARFVDLQEGLVGVATNLLSARLARLQEEGLVRQREAEFGVVVYELTELGAETDAILMALARFGSHFQPDADPRRPGNLRLIAVTLRGALRAVAPRTAQIFVELRIDDEPFDIRIVRGRVDVRYAKAEAPQAVVATSYRALLAVAEGRLDPSIFAARDFQVLSGEPSTVRAFGDLMLRVVSELTHDASTRPSTGITGGASVTMPEQEGS